jgi:hypothetical protein
LTKDQSPNIHTVHPGSTQCAKEPFNGGILLNQKTLTATEKTVTINSAKSGIGGVTNGYRKGSETRPTNMKVMWIMKCW